MRKYLTALIAAALLTIGITTPAHASPNPTPTRTHTVVKVYGPNHVETTETLTSTCGSGWLCLYADVNEGGTEYDFYQTSLQNGSCINLYPGAFDNKMSSFRNNTPYTITVWRDPSCPSGHQEPFPWSPGSHGNYNWLSGFNDALSSFRRTS